MKEKNENRKIPWKESAFSMATAYSILTAMVGVLLAVIITDKKIDEYWYWPIGLLSFSFILFVLGVEKLSDALDENDVDKYLSWFLGYNFGVIFMFFGIATYIFLHYHLCINGYWYIFLIAVIASWKWIHDNFYLLFWGKEKYDIYRKELLGEIEPEKEKDLLMWLHQKERTLLLGFYQFVKRLFYGKRK